MKSKRIKTKESKKLLLLDIGMIVACIIYMMVLLSLFGVEDKFFVIDIIIQAIKMSIEYLPMAQSFTAVTLVIGVALMLIFIAIVIAILFTFPLNAIFLAIRRVYRNNLKQRTMFENIEGIEYFREQFDGVSPATISLVTDLKVEYDKDITATIMKLYLNKNIDFQGDEIVVLNTDTTNLKESEINILNKISENKGKRNLLGLIDRFNWNELCIKEAEKEGYIINKNDKKRVLVKIIVLIILFICCRSVFYAQDYIGDTSNETEIFEKYDEDTPDEVIINDPEFAKGMLSQIGIGISVISGLGMIVLPIYTIVFAIVSKLKKVKYVRTKKGKILQEQIYGMKNFIHNFSYLDEAKKEHAVLWDYYLIYAIVLEENSQIIDEICKYKKVKMPELE